MAEPTESEHIPVNVYRGAGRLTVVAPMPGLDPSDILVEVTANGRLALHGLWGTVGRDEDEEVVLDEWEPGPYHRELDLPAPVDGQRADLTYASGVLSVMLPLAGRARPARLTLPDAGSGRRASAT